MAYTGAERTARCHAKKDEAGFPRKEYRNTPEQHAILKQVSERLKVGGKLFQDRIMVALLGNDHYGEG